MTLVDAVAVVLWTGVTIYAVFGGADFGAGIWDLLAGTTERGQRPRETIDSALSPVWEANHVWLIFTLVTLWTGFPSAFAAITSTLYIPLSLALLGIILRGAGFAFRHEVRTVGRRRLFGGVLATSSVVTPFFLGTVAGSVASGRVPAGIATRDPIDSWLNPTSITCGVLAVAVCAFTAAAFLLHWSVRSDRSDMAGYFRVRTVIAAVVAGVIALAAIFVIREDAPELYDELTGGAALVIALSALAGLVTIIRLWTGRDAYLRPLAVVAVATVMWGWGLASYPDILVGELTLEAAAAPSVVLAGLLVVTGIAGVVVLPALVLLFVLDTRGMLGVPSEEATEAH